MRIFVLGWYGHNNLGDESYKISFTKVWDQHEFIFSDNITEKQEFDLCIIGGGDVIRQENLNRISKLKCPKIALSVTITKLSLLPDLSILDYIYVRDIVSYNNLIDFGYNKTTYIPDISIILKGDVISGKKIIKEYFKQSGSQLYNNICVININAHLLGGPSQNSKDKNIFNKMCYDLVEVMDKTPSSFLFLPFSTSLPWDDRVSNGLVNSYTKFFNKNCVIYEKVSTQDSIDVISASDSIITSRFHGLIFGIGNQISTIPISFHDKMSGFCKTIDHNYIDYWSFSSNEIQKQLKETIKRPFDGQKIISEYREKVHFLW